MRWLAGLAAAIAVVAMAAPAAARVYTIDVTGTLMSGDPNDPKLKVGDQLHLRARFSANNIAQWTGYGYAVAGLYPLGYPGFNSLVITGPGVRWTAVDDQSDGYPPFYVFDKSVETSGGGDFDHRELAAPAIIFAGHTVLGIAGKLAPAGSSEVPILYLGSAPGDGYDDYYNVYADGPVIHDRAFTDSALSDEFTISAGDGLYGNTYETAGFTGIWDFANATFSDVPEPSAWGLLIGGIAALGAVLRRRRYCAGVQCAV